MGCFWLDLPFFLFLFSFLLTLHHLCCSHLSFLGKKDFVLLGNFTLGGQWLFPSAVPQIHTRTMTPPQHPEQVFELHPHPHPHPGHPTVGIWPKLSCPTLFNPRCCHCISPLLLLLFKIKIKIKRISPQDNAGLESSSVRGSCCSS